MPRNSAVETNLMETCALIDELVGSAGNFVARDRSEATVRAWVGRRGAGAVSEDRMMAMAADTMLLSIDYLLSLPSWTGKTAFDRLAKNRSGASAREVSACAALRQARFRLLRVEGGSGPQSLRMRDVLSDEVLTVAVLHSPMLPVGMAVFGRVVLMGPDLACLAGATTPLDEAAYDVAAAHAAAGRPGVAAGARWAEAVYAHVVRHGTLDVPGLNRPSKTFSAAAGMPGAEGGALYSAAMGWLALAGGAPDEDLLARTRQLADHVTIIDALMAAVLARDAGEAKMATAFERLLLVQLETVARRERGGSGKTTLDTVGRAVEAAGGVGQRSVKMRALFEALRGKLPESAAGRVADNPALESLVKRIQALRAKTVAQGCTEQEALAAAEKAAELLDRHGLSLGELEFRAQPCEGIGIQTTRRRMAPIDTCVPGIAAFFDCRTWMEQAKGEELRYVFFGLRGDVAAAQYLYEMVERAFDTETDAFRAGALYASMAGERRTATNSFQIGLARGICGKLHALRETRSATQRSESGRDLVPMKAAVVEDELAKLGINFRAKEIGKGQRVLADAFTAGQAAGARFEVTPGVTKAA